MVPVVANLEAVALSLAEVRFPSLWYSGETFSRTTNCESACFIGILASVSITDTWLVLLPHM